MTIPPFNSQQLVKPKRHTSSCRQRARRHVEGEAEVPSTDVCNTVIQERSYRHAPVPKLQRLTLPEAVRAPCFIKPIVPPAAIIKHGETQGRRTASKKIKWIQTQRATCCGNEEGISTIENTSMTCCRHALQCRNINQLKQNTIPARP